MLFYALILIPLARYSGLCCLCNGLGLLWVTFGTSLRLGFMVGLVKATASQHHSITASPFRCSCSSFFSACWTSGSRNIMLYPCAHAAQPRNGTWLPMCSIHSTMQLRFQKSGSTRYGRMMRQGAVRYQAGMINTVTHA